MKRATRLRLLELAGELSERDRQITETVARLRLLSGAQLQRLHFPDGASEATRARLGRRSLARLVERGLLGRLHRRVGGVRAGAAGHTYYLAAAGQRLVAYWQGHGLQRTRSPYEPTSGLVRHTLAVAECYVRSVEAERAGRARLIEFVAEPDCWERFVAQDGARSILKPDARLAFDLGGGVEEHAFIEVDCDTEGRRALERQCRAYVSAYRAGIGQEVWPRVVWVATTTRRAELIAEVCASMRAAPPGLFAVSTLDELIGLLTAPEAPK